MLADGLQKNISKTFFAHAYGYTDLLHSHYQCYFIQYHTDDKFTLYQSLCVFLNNCCVSCTVIKCNDVIYSVWIESLSHITGVYFYFVLSVTEELESLLDVWAVHFQLHISKTEINVLSLSYTDTVHASTDSLYLVHALIRVMCRKIILILC